MTLKTSLGRLIGGDSASRRLGPPKARSVIPAGQSVGYRTAVNAVASSSGIAWPLIETNRTVVRYLGHYIAVESVVMDGSGSSGTIYWLSPTSPNITVIT